MMEYVMSLRRLAVMVVLVIGMSVLLRPVPTVAQTSNPACPALVELALSQVGNNCADLGRNSACYGFNKLTATFNQSVDPKTFTRPADRSDLATFQTIQTAPLDLGLGQWGIAVMNVQANVPETLPGQAVTFLLLGDSDIENAVKPSDSGVQAVTVILQAATDLRSSADPASAVIGQLAAGTVVDANAISEDGSAIRLKTDNGGGWVNRDAVNANPSLDKLPKVKANSDSPMQSFYFRTRPGGNLDCTQTPSVLTIQSPQHIKVNLTANGANIEMGSLITLQVLPDGVTMQLTTLEGDATVGKGTPDEVDIPAGSTSTHCLSAPQNLGDDGKSNDQTLGKDCKWTQPRSATVSELEEGQTAQAILDRLGLTRTDLVVTPEPTAVATAVAPQPTAIPTVQITPVSVPVDCPVGSNITHVVSAGENLYRISVRYHTSMGAIMAANGITDANRIFSGQHLIIPCGVDTGIPSVPQVPPVIPNNGQQPPIPPIFPTGVDCSRFRATSPLDGLNYGYNVFYWDGAPGATSYRVNVYGLDESKGALVRSFDSAGAVTSLTADITNETTGFGYKFAWDVQALSNGTVACISNRTTMPRGSRPDSGQPNAGVAPTPSTFTATWSCAAAMKFRVDYSGVPSGTTSVTVTYKIVRGGVSPSPITLPVTASSGTVMINSTSTGTITSGSIIASPSGAGVTLPGVLTC
jgi:LysM repeat protein